MLCRCGRFNGLWMTLAVVCASAHAAVDGIPDAEPAPPNSTVYREFKVDVMAEGLKAPDGLAIHPLSGDIYFTEEDASRILRLHGGRSESVIDRKTPIYFVPEKGARRTVEGLRNPEGIAFAGNGDLWVVEDIPGGRLIRYPHQEDGRYHEGEEIFIPGSWDRYAWEGVDIGPQGEILMAGSDVESVALTPDSPGLFSGAILFRDAKGDWWVPYQRIFSSFSAVKFSKSGKQALYACEVTGEIGWLDLKGHQPIGGNSTMVAKSPEGLCSLPNGMMLIAQENGSVVCLDPSSDARETVVKNLGSIESIIWDREGKMALVTADGGGKILALTPDPGYPEVGDMLDFAAYHPIYSPQHVPEKCPTYLADVLNLGGMNVERSGFTNVTLREFTSRVPLIAADARAVPVPGGPQEKDPIVRVQFVVFFPNQLMVSEKGVSLSLSAFAARTQSGKLLRTSVMKTIAQAAELETGTVEPIGASSLEVPQPSAVAVSSLGIATLHFVGLGKMSDFAINLDPRNPAESHMVVFEESGERYHYTLELPENLEGTNDRWIIAYSGVAPEEWVRLSGAPAENGKKP